MNNDKVNDLNTDQAVTDQDLTAGSVDQQTTVDNQAADQTQTQNDVLKDGTDANKQVPYAKLKEASDARKVAEDAAKAAQEQASYAQRQLELMQRNQQQTIQQPVAKTNYEQAMADVGVTADDLILGENQVKVNNRKAELDGQMLQQHQVAMASNQFAQTHSDVNQVVGSIDPVTGTLITPSAELLAIIQQKPHLAAACGTLQGAYDTVMEQRELAGFRKQDKVNKEHLARQQVNTQTGPMGGSAVGGAGGGGSQGQEQLMTREQVLEIQRKLAAGELVT